MTSPAVDHSLEYARKNWPILIAIGTGLVMWGVTFTKVEALEGKQAGRDKDSVSIVKITSEVAQIRLTLQEIKETSKADKRLTDQNIQGLEDKIDSNFRELLLELQRQRTSG